MPAQAEAEAHPVATSAPKSTTPALDKKALPIILRLRPMCSSLLIAPTGHPTLPAAASRTSG